tara:strand:+ start:655 stop:834 length:180 start_codon:yes stop_codon:yes gene_type:complete
VIGRVMKTLTTLLLTLLVSGGLWADDELIALVCEFETSPTNILSYTPEDITIQREERPT